MDLIIYPALAIFIVLFFMVVHPITAIAVIALGLAID